MLFYLWRDQYRAIRFGLPQVGWLLVFLVTILPWLIVMFPKRSFIRGAVKGSMFLHALLTLLTLLVMFNAPIAPWPLFKLQPLLITPYVILAVCIGYLAGYWGLVIRRTGRFEGRALQVSKNVVQGVYFPALAILFLTVGALNFRFIDRRATVVVDRLVDAMVRQIGDRRWLISNGYFDDLIELRIRREGRRLILINAAQGKSESYLKYLSTLFEDPRLKSLAQVGLEPFLDEWLGGTPGLQKEVAVLASPDIWFSSGYTPCRMVFFFLGMTNLARVDVNRWYAEQKGFWNQYRVILQRESERKWSLASGWNQWIARHLSKMANNTGVLLEDLGKGERSL